MTTINDVVLAETVIASDLDTPEARAMRLAGEECCRLGFETMHGMFVATEWPRFLDEAKAILPVRKGEENE